ncbi:MAG: helix-turn-helix domain-containing protein [Ruminiclostridium sp.]|nr:helix-turn-helix domain-containing protein [Ruminiclostridium sp.]
MNIEIANRLVNLRKENGFSQEQLAEKIGVSRQAVSKWERSEASPDTDNIILLARLYNVSLDELLRTEDDIPSAELTDDDSSEPDVPAETFPAEAETEEEPPSETAETEEIAPEAEKTSELSVSENDSTLAIIRKRVLKRWDELNIHIGLDGIYFDKPRTDAEYRAWQRGRMLFAVPVIAVITVLYLLFSLMTSDLLDGLFLFMGVPIICSFESAVRGKDPAFFAFPLVIAALFIFVVSCGAGDEGLILWLTVPPYYWICRAVKKQKQKPTLFAELMFIIYLGAAIMFREVIFTLPILLLIPIYYTVKGFIKK